MAAIRGVLFLLIISLISGGADAAGLQLSVEPSRVAPGDPFVVTLRGKGLPDIPEGTCAGKSLSFVRCGDDCWMAVGATDLTAKPGRYRVVTGTGTRRLSAAVTLFRKTFPVVRMHLPAGHVTLSDPDAERAVQEEGLLRQLWQVRSGKKWEGDFALPLTNEISTTYGVKRIMNGSRESLHRGIDMRGAEGEKVLAANRGTVALASELFFGGNTLVLDHGGGIYTVYMHLQRFARNVGDMVNKGDVIGYVGASGRATGPHLHFGVKVGDVSVNPAAFFALPFSLYEKDHKKGQLP